MPWFVQGGENGLFWLELLVAFGADLLSHGARINLGFSNRYRIQLGMIVSL